MDAGAAITQRNTALSSTGIGRFVEVKYHPTLVRSSLHWREGSPGDVRSVGDRYPYSLTTIIAPVESGGGFAHPAIAAWRTSMTTRHDWKRRYGTSSGQKIN